MRAGFGLSGVEQRVGTMPAGSSGVGIDRHSLKGGSHPAAGSEGIGEMRQIAYLALSLLLSGCAGGGLNKQSLQIEPGMPASAVQSILGMPQNRQFNGKKQAWQYCRTSILGASDKYVLVWLYDGRVTGMKTYRNTRLGFCQDFFRTVKWEQAPDITVEVRRR